MAVGTKVRSDRPAATGPRPAVRRFADGTRRDVVVGALTALGALILACLVLQVWHGDLDVPFDYEQETQYYLMLAKGIEDHGGYFENPRLGAPFGLELHDYAVGTDRLHLDLLRLLLVFGDPAFAVNLAFLLGFALAAASAYLVFRLLRVPAAPASVSAALFALAPYHFSRGEEHLFLSGYWAVPLAAYLVLATLGGESLFRRLPGRTGPLAWASGRTLLTVAFCVAAASTGIYYAGFTLLLLGAATVLALLARAGRQAVAGGAICLALVLAVLLLHLSPSILYRSEHGVNTATVRPRTESELLALKFSDLVFPVEDSRLGPLAEFTERYRTTTPIESEGGQALGPVAAAGFLGLIAVALVALVARRRVGPPVVRDAAAATVLAFLIGTVGGISTVVAYLFTTQVRGWNRISIFIAFFSFLAVALALGRLGRALGPSTGRRAVYGAVLAGVLAFGVYTQTTASNVPPYDLATSYRQDRSFVREIERRLPSGAAVFQLPYVAFPETGQIRDLFENDLLRGYLHSERLHWSFGAMKNRPEEWADELSRLPTATIVDGALAAGFSGLYVDRFAYPDRANALEVELRTLLGTEPLLGASGRHFFFDLRARAGLSRRTPEAFAALRRAVLEPLELEQQGFAAPLERAEQYTFAWAEQPQTELRIVNPSEEARTAEVHAVVDRLEVGPVDVEVVFPGSPPMRVRTPSPIRKELTLPPGPTVIRFSTSPALAPTLAYQRRPHFFRVANLTVTDSGFQGFLEVQ